MGNDFFFFLNVSSENRQIRGVLLFFNFHEQNISGPWKCTTNRDEKHENCNLFCSCALIQFSIINGGFIWLIGWCVPVNDETKARLLVFFDIIGKYEREIDNAIQTR